MKVAKLEGTKIVNLAVANSLDEGWTDVSGYARVGMGGDIVDGVYVSPVIDDRLILVGTEWVATMENLLVENEKQREAFEVGGMVLSSGLQISTSDKAQAKIHGAVTTLQDEPEGTTVNFIANRSQDIPMALPEIKAVFKEVVGHVQSGLAKQGELIAKIQSGEITTFKQLEAEWL